MLIIGKESLHKESPTFVDNAFKSYDDDHSLVSLSPKRTEIVRSLLIVKSVQRGHGRTDDTEQTTGNCGCSNCAKNYESKQAASITSCDPFQQWLD